MSMCREYDANGALVREWETDEADEPAPAQVDVTVLQKAIQTAKSASTQGAKINALIAGLEEAIST